MKCFLLFACLIISYSLAAQFPSFKHHIIGETGFHMGQTALVDLDNDSDLDWVFGESGKLSWFEYQSADKWVLHPLGEGALSDLGACVMDINNDGKNDFAVGNGWYENSRDPVNIPFKFHFNACPPSNGMLAVDINGDGKKDIVSNSNSQLMKHLTWHNIGNNPNEQWQTNIIGRSIYLGITPKGYGDLDNDGDVDIVRGNSWFENTTGNAYSWTEHPVLVPKKGNSFGDKGLGLKVWVADMDNDNDLDVVEAECGITNARVFWFENRNQGKKWKCHPVEMMASGQDFHSLAVVDFDLDGDLDIFSGGGPLSTQTFQWVIWENIDGTSTEWKRHIILEGFRCHEAQVGDVDNDGDIDICSKPWNGYVHVFLENKLINKENELSTSEK